MKLKKENFKPLLNTKFTITFDKDNKYEVELIQIEEHDPIPSLDIEPFTLTFRGDKSETIFAQRTYKIKSEEIGELALFFIPRIPDKEGIYYDVIVN